MSITHLRIQGLRNVTAIGHLEKSLEAVPGVQAVRIDSTGEEAMVEHDGADPKLLIAAAAELGYRAEHPLPDPAR